MATPTKERLAERLHAIGLFELEKEARAGAFSDFESESATPKVDLVMRLNGWAQRAQYPAMAKVICDLATEVKDGKWDDTKEESDAWFKREGKDLLK